MRVYKNHGVFIHISHTRQTLIIHSIELLKTARNQKATANTYLDKAIKILWRKTSNTKRKQAKKNSKFYDS